MGSCIISTDIKWTRGDSFRTLAAAVILVALLGLAYLLSTKEGASTAPITLLIGVSLGIVLERGRFCFYCIFRDGIEDKNTTGMLSVFAAIAAGAIGYAIIFGQFLPNTTTDRLPPLAHIGPVSIPLAIGAFLFGIGMTLSGACISGHLYRIGQGYLRAIPALIGTLIGFAIAFLVWNPIYLNFISESPTIWIPHLFGYSGSLILTLVVVTLLAVVAVKKGINSEPISGERSEKITFRSIHQKVIINRWNPLVTGGLVGAIGTVAYLRVEPLGVTRQISTTTRTLSLDNGVGPETLNGLDKMAGCIAVVSEAITNNGWLVIGLVGASLAVAIAGNRFKLSAITPVNATTALIGGVLLGFGAMISLGCTVGVLLSGTQAFALSGWLFFASVFLGVWTGIKLKLHKSN
ncbi:MAG: YeeE/YedE family protein [Actinomycetota bacterium]